MVVIVYVSHVLLDSVMTNKFRPLQLPPSYKHKAFLKKQKHRSFNWVPYQLYTPDSYKPRALTKAFRVLHYLASHSPNKLRLKYQNNYTRLVKKHIPSKAGMDYTITYSPF